MAEFIQGIPLARGFYHECVAPVLNEAAPRLSYSAGIIGHGSEVLGFDTDRSTDHHWGPRVMLFLREEDLERATELSKVLAQKLPYEYGGYPTNFSSPDPDDSGVQSLEHITTGLVNHRCEMLNFHDWVRKELGVDPREPRLVSDWLSFPTQRLAGVTGGALFRDDLDVGGQRADLRWYPDDVWLFLMACQWTRIAQDEHIVGRAAEVGDDIGSRLIAGQLVRDVMRLAFLMERVYAPYAKWFGTAFAALQCGSELGQPLAAALAASRWSDRERALSVAFEVIAEKHNDLRVTASLDPTVRPFHGRPFQVIDGSRFANALMERIGDEALRKRLRIGGIDCVSDNTDLLENPQVIHDWFVSV